jgi:hypothetical protein
MIVFFKCYKRFQNTLLCIQSVRHLFPEIDIRCLFLYDEDPFEYYRLAPSLENLNVKMYHDKKTYNFGNGKGSDVNGYYFTEGINKMQKLVSSENKVLFLDEDQFFTTGATIQFLLDTDFDLAYATWPAPQTPAPYGRPSVEINGAIVAVNPQRLNHLFPLPEQKEYIELLLGRELHDKAVAQGFKVVDIPTRKYTDFFGDGVHTNDIETMKQQLNAHNIPFNI